MRQCIVIVYLLYVKLINELVTPYGKLQKMVSRPGNHFEFYLHTNSKLSNKKECTHEKNVNKRIK